MGWAGTLARALLSQLSRCALEEALALVSRGEEAGEHSARGAEEEEEGDGRAASGLWRDLSVAGAEEEGGIGGGVALDSRAASILEEGGRSLPRDIRVDEIGGRGAGRGVYCCSAARADIGAAAGGEEEDDGGQGMQGAPHMGRPLRGIGRLGVDIGGGGGAAGAAVYASARIGGRERGGSASIGGGDQQEGEGEQCGRASKRAVRPSTPTLVEKAQDFTEQLVPRRAHHPLLRFVGGFGGGGGVWDPRTRLNPSDSRKRTTCTSSVRRAVNWAGRRRRAYRPWTPGGDGAGGRSAAGMWTCVGGVACCRMREALAAKSTRGALSRSHSRRGGFFERSSRPRARLFPGSALSAYSY
ncbi:hypothetical protein DFH09DRAFT_1278933 [Mycena vulgaris]|nr:hypothetical protein DFH09DRAFT_1278933 [Mycena vulgaris]